MRTPLKLTKSFESHFQLQLEGFLRDQGALPEDESLDSKRFLSRSIIPHIRRLSDLFNRLDSPEHAHTPEAGKNVGLDQYWQKGSNPQNLRLAYMTNFMPTNAFRVASIVQELSRRGFFQSKAAERFHTEDKIRVLELGAGPGSGSCGVALGLSSALDSSNTQTKKPLIEWTLVEQSKSLLDWGENWLERYASSLGFTQSTVKGFCKKIDPTKPFLPKEARRFDVIVSSFFLNELAGTPEILAKRINELVTHHLTDNGIFILCEPALMQQSRRLLEIRQLWIENHSKQAKSQVLLPCLGHQACGSLTLKDDWCHEEVSWWRPPYLRIIDQLTGFDRKTLDFSYLVFIRSPNQIGEILTGLTGTSEKRFRYISPVKSAGPDYEGFICGQSGKSNCRIKKSLFETSTDAKAATIEAAQILEAMPKKNETEQAPEEDAPFFKKDTRPTPERGDLLEEVELRGDPACKRASR